MFLEETEAIAGVVELHRVDREGVAEFVGADSMDFPRLGIDYLGKPRFLGALAHDLPGTMPVNPEEKKPTALLHRAAPVEVFSERVQGAPIQWQSPHSPMLQLSGHRLIYFRAASGAKGVALPQQGTASGAGQPESGFEVLDPHCPLFEADVVRREAQGLGDTAAQVKEQPDEQAVAEIGGCLLQLADVFRFQVGFCGTISGNLWHWLLPPFVARLMAPAMLLHVFAGSLLGLDGGQFNSLATNGTWKGDLV